jgi:hypothetical protein
MGLDAVYAKVQKVFESELQVGAWELFSTKKHILLETTPGQKEEETEKSKSEDQKSSKPSTSSKSSAAR